MLKNNAIYYAMRSSTLPKSFWFSVLLTAIWMLAFETWAIVAPNNNILLYEANIATIMLLSAMLSLVLSLIGVRKAYRNIAKYHPQRHSLLLLPLIFSLVSLFQCLGNLAFFVLGVQYQGNIPFPSVGDAAILVTYPILLFGVFLLPTPTISRIKRLGILLDSLLVIIGLVTFSWFFLLGPMLAQANTESLLAMLVRLAHPCCDLALVSCAIFFTIAGPEKNLRSAIRVLVLGLVMFAIADSTYQYQILQHTSTLGWTSPAWSCGDFLIVLAAQMLSHILTQRKSQDAPTTVPAQHNLSMWRSLLPYILVPATIILVCYVWDTDRSSPLAIGTYACGFLLIALLFIKQIITIQETHRLNKGLQESQQALQTQNALLEQANTRLENLATTDPLTELPNHRALISTITTEMERAKRYQRSCTLLFFDLDHFKALNDGYGHATGDEILIAFSHLIHQQVRCIDTVGRWGGEEFVAILPETTREEAEAIAERLREVVNQQTFAVGGGLHLTCSIGMASYPEHANDLNALVNAADQAMYAAKRLGRNQVRHISDPAVQLILANHSTEGDREQTALQGFVKALVSLAKQRNPAMGDHAYAVARLAEQLATRLGVGAPEVQMIGLAAQLHDIGKVSIPDIVLQKPARLTQDEWYQMKKHTLVGAEIVSYIPALRPLAPVIRAHHERWDGMGYPDQLQGEDIPLASRIITVADAYMAMTIERPYRRARASEDALEELQRCAGTQFDAHLVETLAILLQEQQVNEQATIAA